MSVDNELPGELTAGASNTLPGSAFPTPLGSGSRFDLDFLASAVDDLMYQFGVTVIYTPVGEDAVQLSMIVMDQGEERDLGEMGKQAVRYAIGKVRLEDVATPQIGDTVSYGGRTLSVAKIFGTEGGMAELGLEATSAVERSSGQHRRRYPLRVRPDQRG